MIKLKSLLMENYWLYHITPTKNLNSMKRRGIVPQALAPADVSDKKAVYLFKDKADVDDALMNWLGDKFDEDEPLSILTLKPEGINLVPSSAAYEVMSYDAIPWSNVVGIEDI